MFDIEIIKTHASGRWPEILLHLAPHISTMIERGRRHGPCPLCGGKDRARCHDDFNETGGVYCNQCRGASKGLGVLMWANDWHFKETMQSVSDYLGLTNGRPLPPMKAPSQPTEPEKDWNRERQRLQAIWEGTVPDTGRIRRYLESRGLFMPAPPTLRLHPNLNYYHEGPPVRYPTMVARFTRDDETIALHYTYLHPTQDGKADCSKPRTFKKCIPEKITGGAIQLFPFEPGKPLVIAEGIENGLAVRHLTGFQVWASGTAGMQAEVKPPSGAQEIYIAGDKDKSGHGQRSVKKLAHRLFDETGRGATISLPPGEIPDGKKSIDWNDYVAQGQEVANV